MIDSLPSGDPIPQKRRSTRVVQAVPITVTGVDALGQPFKERTTTVMVNCHGCKYQSKHYVPKNSTVTLDIPRPEPGSQPRSAIGRVVWVQRPRAVRELFQIGVEFENAGNVWGIAFPPSDWFARTEDTSSVTAPPQSAIVSDAKSSTEPHAVLLESATAGQPNASAAVTTVSAPGATVVATSAAPASAPSTLPSESKIHLMPVSQPLHDAAPDTARQLARMVAEAKESIEKSARREAQAAINEEMIVVRQLLDAQLHETIERAIKNSIERVSESESRRIIQQAERRTTEIAEETRKAQEAAAAQLDTRIRQAVEQGVHRAAEQAAEQAITENLKQAVEQIVARVVTEREATLPSLQILSSPEAAQQQLEQWKRNLEETSLDVRNHAAEQTQADTAAASRRWQEELEANLSGASQKLFEKLNDTSQHALARAGEDFVVRTATLRASLDGAVAAAQAAVQSLSAELDQERVRMQQTKDQIADIAQSALNHTRQGFDEMLSAHCNQIGERADQVIAERTQHLEPVLQNSAQKVIEHFSGELDRKLAPGLEEARKVLSDLSQSREQTQHLQENLYEQIHQASERAISESLNRLREETAKYPAGFEESCRASLSKVEAELGQKTSEIQHETYETLLKAADWYQKKAQNTMQSALDKVIERSAEALRDRAAEVSSLVASELDHHRRTYLDYSQAQIEEAAKEVVDRQRTRLNESVDIANATFTDRVQHVSGESLRRFDEASASALEKARSDMEYNRESSLAQFQKTLDERMTQGADQARTYLQSQLVPMMESWEASRELQQREWIDQLKATSDELVEQYKTRLGNTSNAWLLASATTLGQNSQAIMDTLGKSAEERLRETFAQVMAGMGDTLKARLLGLSTDFNPGDNETKAEKK